MTISHNVMHQYSAGVSSNSVTGPVLPFTTPGQQGWKVLYESWDQGYALEDGAKWESVVETSGTATYGVNGLLLTTNGSDDSSAWLGHTTPNTMIGAATKKFYLEASFTLVAATMASNEMYIGFSTDVQTTSFVNAGGTAWVFVDGFGFGKLVGATELDFISRDASVEQTVGLGVTPTTATKMKVACYYDGANFLLYVDDVLKSTTAKTSLNVDTAMGLVTYCKAGTGAAQTLTTNYVLLATEL